MKSKIKKVSNSLQSVFSSKKYTADPKRFINNKNFKGKANEAINKNSRLHNIFKNHNNYVSVKWEQYLSIYERIFKPFIDKGRPVDILEIGILNGGFLEILEKFFPKNSKIIGFDINEKCASLKYSKNIKVCIGNATKKDFVEKNLKNSEFDIIIDDASHMCKDVINTFNLTFDKLKPGGIYIVEDCHTSYWYDYKGGYKKKESIIEYFKDLVDSLNFYYINPKITESKKFKKIKEYKSSIASISFYDSVIVIEKYAKPRKTPFRNYITEKKDLIQPKQVHLSYGSLECNKNTLFEKFFK